MRVVILAVCVILTACTVTDPRTTSNPAPGVALELARARAERVSDLAYDLRFNLQAGMKAVSGDVRISFQLSDPYADLPIDFAGEDLQDVVLNGDDWEPQRVENHIVLPAERLRSGENVLQAQFASRVAPTGTPLTVYRDKSDKKEYLYTLVVPADAHRLFPCFDQPDLKGRFSLQLVTPGDWVAVSNGREQVLGLEDGRRRWTFALSEPLPTYLFAFAAGPFETVSQPGIAGTVRGLRDPMRILVRASKRKELDAQTVFRMHGASVAWQETYFGHDYPFGKLDIVLCPGFPYGGMEHAGAIFYRESALAFDHDPTEIELLRRSSLIYHEVSHQWFGNLVTMRWFDDLWLKEGFATFIGYRTLDALEPNMNAWMRFHQRVKPAAYRIDVTEGTTPIWQELQNLADAKSAYGPIVYNKAPAVLRQLEHHLGAERFRDGVRAFLREHAFGNATWRDLLAALATASGKDLDSWSKRSILDRGLPRVVATSGETLDLRQEDALGAGRSWPLSINVLAGRSDGTRKSVRFELDGTGSHSISDADWILANADAVAFAQVVLDERSLAYWLEHLPEEKDPLVKAVAFTAVWDSVKESACPPERFVELALVLVERERDPQTWSSAMGALSTTLVRYLPAELARPHIKRTTALLGRLLDDATSQPIRLQVLRTLAGLARDDAALARIEAILDGTRSVPGITLGIQDKFRLVRSLLAAQRAGAHDRLSTLEQGGADVARWSFQAKAAIPTSESKDAYFASFLQENEPPEQWVSGALGAFHHPGQESLVLPYLRRALDAAPWVKENRKIFFMPAWLESFLGAHASTEALETVDSWLEEHPDLPPDIRRKLLVPLHELRRSVRIREGAP